MANNDEQSIGQARKDNKLADYLVRRRRRTPPPTMWNADNRIVKPTYLEAEDELMPNEIGSYLQSKRSIKNSAKLLDDNNNIIAANRITLLADEPNSVYSDNTENKINEQQQNGQVKTIQLLPSYIPTSRNGVNDKNSQQQEQIRLEDGNNSNSSGSNGLHKQQTTSQTLFSSTDLLLILLVVYLMNRYFNKICHLLRLNSIVRLLMKPKRRPSDDDELTTAIKREDCEQRGKLATLRRSVAKNSLVVAMDNATRPKVQLVTERLKRFVELDNGVEEANGFKSWLNRQLGGNTCATSQGETTNELNSTQPTTIEVTVHRSARDDSLVGLAGSFIERQNQSVQSHQPRADEAMDQLNSLVAQQQTISPASDRPSLSQSLASNSSTSINNLTTSKRAQLAPETTSDLARSKSQTSAAQGSSYLAPAVGAGTSKSISPSQLRPCCSVSPSAMGRLAAANQQATPTSRQQLVGALIGRNQSADRAARHRYESYYDDEHEDIAYRRLTASIGMQFGLGYDDDDDQVVHRQQSAARQAPIAATCQCCSAPTSVAVRMVASSGDTTSDSGSFSLLNTACSEPQCSMCRSPQVGGAEQPNSNMSILVQQPSLSTPPPPNNVSPPHEPTIVQQQHRPSIGECPPAGYPLVSRWNHRRRSTMSSCSRSPRRMSVATIGHWQPPAGQLTGANNNNSAIQQQHLMHRASIAADGSAAIAASSHFGGLVQYAANGAHQQAPTNSGSQPYARAHPLFSRQPSGLVQTTQLSRTVGGSQYSSSAGSSSGIGFTGSQCTNTPTASACPFGSFVANGNNTGGGAYPLSELFGAAPQQKQARCCDYDPAASWDPRPNSLVYHQQHPHNHQHLHQHHQQQHLTSCKLQAPMMCQGASLLPPGSRKFSLPVQLESHAAGRIRDAQASNLLFDMNLTQADDGQQQQQQQRAEDELTSVHQVRSGEVEEQRRSSQTIARQSSFWLEEDTNTNTNTNNSPTATKSPPHKSPASSASSRPPSSTSSSSSPDSAAAGAAVRTSKAGRSLNLGPSTSSSISKRRLLGKLSRSRRSHRRLGSSSSRTKDAPTNSSVELNSTDDDDDERTVDKNTVVAAQSDHDTDQNSSLDRDFLAAPPAAPERRALADVNSASLERQCRELWKLRSTLHQDATLGDNWSNYHQRLNRRYDSGYKSIENQFSSSIEGNGAAAVATAAAARNQSPTVRLEAGENEVFEQEDEQRTTSALSPQPEKANDLLSRPQSGCSNFITEPTTARQQRTPTPLSNDEDTK